MAVAIQEAQDVKDMIEKNVEKRTTPKLKDYNDASALFDNDQLDHSEEEMLVIHEVNDIDNSMNQSDPRIVKALKSSMKSSRICAWTNALKKPTILPNMTWVHCMSDLSKMFLSHLKVPNKLGEFNFKFIYFLK